MRLAALSNEIASSLGVAITLAEPIRGGDSAATYRCDLADGRIVVAKTHDNPPPHFFSTEATSLRWLSEAGARVPEVLAVSDETPAHIVLAWIQPGRSTREGDAAFGRSLAQLHRRPFGCFGRPDGRPTGSHALPNKPVDSWIEHYGGNRLLPLAKHGRDLGALSSQSSEDLEKVANSLNLLGGPVEPPSLLHGDLWAGNRIVDTAGQSWMIDPAAVGGHREFDLAMMKLFGGYGPDCFQSYGEEFPLADGWNERVILHQLAPLAVHAIKFGGHYVGALDDALDTLLGRSA